MKRTEGKKERKKKYRQENIVPTTLRLPSPSPLFQGMGGGGGEAGEGATRILSFAMSRKIGILSEQFFFQQKKFQLGRDCREFRFGFGMLIMLKRVICFIRLSVSES